MCACGKLDENDARAHDLKIVVFVNKLSGPSREDDGHACRHETIDGGGQESVWEQHDYEEVDCELRCAQSPRAAECILCRRSAKLTVVMSNGLTWISVALITPPGLFVPLMEASQEMLARPALSVGVHRSVFAWIPRACHRC